MGTIRRVFRRLKAVVIKDAGLKKLSPSELERLKKKSLKGRRGYYSYMELSRKKNVDPKHIKVVGKVSTLKFDRALNMAMEGTAKPNSEERRHAKASAKYFKWKYKTKDNYPKNKKRIVAGK